MSTSGVKHEWTYVRSKRSKYIIHKYDSNAHALFYYIHHLYIWLQMWYGAVTFNLYVFYLFIEKCAFTQQILEISYRLPWVFFSKTEKEKSLLSALVLLLFSPWFGFCGCHLSVASLKASLVSKGRDERRITWLCSLLKHSLWDTNQRCQ